mmetsp:Transcript_12790/g.38100  ORF Transcript_12790/g.38100 Transcript_12790/m.38100 type:complete len:251 (+) Transcript_12790:81-833(+)
MGRAARERAAKARLESFVLACINGDADAVAKAIKDGADVNECGTFGPISGGQRQLATPLIAGHQHLPVVKLLLEAGADINQVVRLTDGGRMTVLQVAALTGNSPTCEYLLDHGADINGSVDARQSPLHCAARHGRLELVELLIKRGADHKLPDADGHSALRRAHQSGQRAVFELLMSVPRVRKSMERRLCNFCGKTADLTEPTFKVCARCRGPRYCSRACQVAHWRAASPHIGPGSNSSHRDVCAALPPG